MALNPQLVQTSGGAVPAPFPNEAMLLRRDAIKLEVDNMPTRNGKTPTPAESGDALSAIDLPLVYIRKDKFNQPIFGCNNLSGECWSVCDDGGPTGSLPPHSYKLSFIEGGVGTFLPMYFTFLTAAREAERDRKRSDQLQSFEQINTHVGQAFVDPNDPSTLFLSQPVSEDQRLGEAPKYAQNYGSDESYLPMV